VENLHEEELSDLYSSPNIIRLIKSRIMGGGDIYPVCGRGKVNRSCWWGNVRERDHLEEPDVDGRIILSWIFRKCDGGMVWIDLAQEKDRW